MTGTSTLDTASSICLSAVSFKSSQLDRRIFSFFFHGNTFLIISIYDGKSQSKVPCFFI
jgi:hypothetical protein